MECNVADYRGPGGLREALPVRDLGHQQPAAHPVRGRDREHVQTDIQSERLIEQKYFARYTKIFVAEQ